MKRKLQRYQLGVQSEMEEKERYGVTNKVLVLLPIIFRPSAHPLSKALVQEKRAQWIFLFLSN